MSKIYTYKPLLFTIKQDFIVKTLQVEIFLNGSQNIFMLLFLIYSQTV